MSNFRRCKFCSNLETKIISFFFCLCKWKSENVKTILYGDYALVVYYVDFAYEIIRNELFDLDLDENNKFVVSNYLLPFE